MSAPKRLVNLLTFLQNGNVVRIRDNEEYNRFGQILFRHGLNNLCGSASQYPAEISRIIKSNHGDRLLREGEWDGKTLYAECQIGKGSIGICPYAVRATVGWYGQEPLSVDDIDDISSSGKGA